MSHESHIIPLKVYFGVWLVLLLGTAMTVVAAFLKIGALHVPVMLLIAIVKASLVAMFFMHLYYDDKFNTIIFLGSLLFVLIFFAFTLIDPMTRGTIQPIEKNPIAPIMMRPGVTKPFHDSHTTSTTMTSTVTHDPSIH